MKKVKQILAIIGVIFLVGLYLTTLVVAIIDNTNGMVMLKASVVATIIIPVLMWAYALIYRLTRGDKKNDESKPEQKDK